MVKLPFMLYAFALLASTVAMSLKPKCSEVCPAVYQPVCGSDENTYPNECSLKVADCKSDKNITVIYIGPCVKPKCPEICPAVLMPVCGSDGKTYDNKCTLKVADCKSSENITVKHAGPCVKPKCPELCPAVYQPVCGSDGNTYPNECSLKVADCKSDENITVLYLGPCVSTPPLIECGLEVCSYYAMCSEINGTKKCACRLACPLNYSPVCGSDGKTYPNECAMKGESCRQKEWIYKNHDGECMKPKCPENCPRIYDPVCASDGKTYSNECNLKVADCKSEEDIEVMYVGRCVSTPPLVECGLEICSYYAICSEINGTKKCVCRLACPRIYSPVCGSDGKTYPNECVMKGESCRQKEWIYKNHDGECMKPKCPENCSKIYDPVCASDGKTYSNECNLKVADCKSEEDIEVMYIGPCVSTPALVECGLEMCSYYAMCLEINGTKKCVCPEVCPLFYSPVCGSDGKTYSNECFMMVESCRQKEWIYKNHDGKCMKPKCREGCPKIYDPVCGSDGKTYSNECVLKVADCKSEEKIEVIYIGSCEPF